MADSENWYIVDTEKFTKIFSDYGIPEEILWLCEYQKEIKGYASGYFLAHPRAHDSLPDWLSGQYLGAMDSLIMFGDGPDGSLYGFWFYNDIGIDNAPIVFADSAWDPCKVIAHNLKEFLSLLAVGYDELGQPDGIIEENEAIHKFQKHLKQKYNFDPSTDPEKIMKLAFKDLPNFMDWLCAFK